MIDVADFYFQLAGVTTRGADEQIILPGEIRVQAAAAGWTAIFDSSAATAPTLEGAFLLARQFDGLVPFLTRSGRVGLKWASPSVLPQTTEGLRVLRAALLQLVET